jgi:uncharacterized protein
MPWNQECSELDVSQEELEELPPLHRLAFAASICERMLPNYAAFSKTTGMGNFAVLRSALDEIWEILQGKPINVEIIDRLLRDCQDAVPDRDDGGQYNYEAEETAIAILYTLEANLEPTPSRVAKVSEHVGDLLYNLVLAEKETIDPCWEEKPFNDQIKDVVRHPFAVREIAKQNEDLQRLKSIKTLDPDFLKWLRTSFDNDGKSLIDLS